MSARKSRTNHRNKLAVLLLFLLFLHSFSAEEKYADNKGISPDHCVDGYFLWKLRVVFLHLCKIWPVLSSNKKPVQNVFSESYRKYKVLKLI